jgi:hypothetical protein
MDSSLFRVFLSCGALAILLTGQSAPASAATITVEYRLADGGGAGLLLDATRVGTVYQVNKIDGNRNGIAINSRTAYAHDDNLFYPSPPYVDHLGLAYTLKEGSPNAFAFFYDDGKTQPDPFACRGPGLAGYCEIGPGVAFTTGLGPPIDKVTAITDFEVNFNIGNTIPEPSTWILIGVGFAALGGLTAYRRSPNAIF